jgi:hypothetical protein
MPILSKPILASGLVLAFAAARLIAQAGVELVDPAAAKLLSKDAAVQKLAGGLQFVEDRSGSTRPAAATWCSATSRPTSSSGGTRREA